MSLAKYHSKRRFNETPEPKGKIIKASKALHFVVQKHAATRLHYDFRLEHAGVLVSWAVPRGPSLNTQDKRLAMMVEDHPIDYMKFEGVIPAGNYGAGSVMVWDFGNYFALGAKNLAESEKMMKIGLKKGEFKFVLNGQKLKGGYVLVRTKGFGGKKNSWLLIKERDGFVSKKDVTKQDKSVLSKKSMEQIAKSNKKWISNKKR